MNYSGDALDLNSCLAAFVVRLFRGFSSNSFFFVVYRQSLSANLFLIGCVEWVKLQPPKITKSKKNLSTTPRHPIINGFYGSTLVVVKFSSKKSEQNRILSFRITDSDVLLLVFRLVKIKPRGPECEFIYLSSERRRTAPDHHVPHSKVKFSILDALNLIKTSRRWG